MARITLDPQTRHASLAMSFGSQMFGDRLKPDIAESSAVLGEDIQRAMKGDLSLASRIYTSQAISLDSLFTEMARRSGNNMGQYPDAADRYMRLALKAQAACRSTLEALARLHQPREQTVKHVHVSEGGQAVVADQFHHHTGGEQNGKMRNSPMSKAHAAPRCLAKTRSGTACRLPALKGKKRCQLHGGRSPGPPKGNRNARKHGGYSAKTVAAMRYLKTIARLVREVD